VCAELAHTLAEGVASARFRVLRPTPGVPFDDGAMEDVFADAGPALGAVLCATELGLVCARRLDPGTGGASGSRPAQVEETVIMRPKVLREGVEDLL
jgi:hypothetical protein